MENEPSGENQPNFWADLLLCVWVLTVAVFFFGPTVWPTLGTLTSKSSVFYAVMTLVAAVTLALKFLRRAGK